MALFTGIYVIAGGYMATAINDFIQGIIMLIGIIAVIAAVLNTPGRLHGSDERVWPNVSDPAVSASPGAFASFFGPDPLGPARRRDADIAGHLGPAPDGPEVLCHQK